MGNSAVTQRDLVRRYKNISDRETPASHISLKVYEAAQNQSHYNSIYSFVGRNSPLDSTQQSGAKTGASLQDESIS